MQGKHLYEYAVIRLVPRVEREEFFNVGIILFSKRAKYIKALYKVDEDKLICFLLSWTVNRCLPICMFSIKSVPARKRAALSLLWTSRNGFGG